MRLVYDTLTDIPVGFTEVEYLEADGTQYINTGLLSTASSKVDCVFGFSSMESGGAENCAIFGGRSGTTVNTFTFFKLASGNPQYFRFDYNGQLTVGTANQMTWNTSSVYRFVYDGRNATSTNITTGQTEAVTRSPGSSFTPVPICLFCVNYTSNTSVLNPTQFMKGRIYKYWYTDGVNTIDFVPCLDNNNVPCMWDKVGGKAYYNAGTGSFTYGRKIIPVEYLESTGTQYIDTGIKGKNNLHYKSKVNFTTLSTSGSNGIGGEYLANASAYIGMVRANGHYTYLFNNTAVETTITIYTNTDYEIDSVMNSGSQVLKVNGETISTGTLSGTFTSTRNIFLYAICSTNDAADVYGSLKMYYCQIYDNDILVRDFIPCIDENLTPFMFDRLTHTVYLNAGTGSFTFGKVMPKKKLRLIKESKRRLPKGFTEVEYLESTGTQYIDTGFIPTENTRTVARLFTTQTGNKNWFGGQAGGNANYCFNSFSTTQIEYIFGNTNWQRANVSAVNKQFTVDFSKNGIYIDDELIATPSYTAFGAGTLSIMLYVRNGGSARINGRTYYLKIYDSGLLVRDFVPCLDNNNVPCMWDRVEQKAYYNVGTGTFSYGHTITPVEYLETTAQGTTSTTKPWINTLVNYWADFEIGVKLRASASNVCLSCGGGAYRLERINATNPYWRFQGGGSGYNYDSTIPITEYHVLKWKDGKISCDGEVLVERDHLLNSGTYTTLFTTSTASGNTVYPNVVYFLKMWNPSDGTLVRDYIPVKDENNVGYMFDKLSHTLYANAGTGSFTVGNELKDKVRFIQDVIPSAYLPLKYLESNGNQYIDTGIHPTDTYGYRIKNTYTVGQGEQCAIGCMDTGNRFVGIYTPGSANSISGGWGSFVGFLPNYTWTTGTILDVKCNYKNSRKIIIDKTEMKDITDIHITGTISNTLCLFGRNSGGITKMNGKIYGAQVTNGQDIVLDLYPALRKSDNKPGMYDRITKQFFVNQGTGEFNYEI